MGAGQDIRVDTRRIGQALAATVALPVVLNAVAVVLRRSAGHPNPGGLVRLVSLDRELTIPTYVSGLLLLVAGLLALGMARFDGAEGRRRRGWRLLALALVVFSFDEVCMIHEGTSGAAGRAIGEDEPSVYLWVIWAFMAVPALALVQIPFVVSLDAWLRTRLVVTGVVFTAAALGIEVLELVHADRNGAENYTQELLTSTQETIELAATAYLVHLLLRAVFVARDGRPLRVTMPPVNPDVAGGRAPTTEDPAEVTLR